MSVYYQPGPHVCRVIGQQLGMTSHQNVQFVLTFMVLGTPDPANADNYLALPKQLSRPWYCVLTDKTLEHALEDLHLLGFPPNLSFGRLDPKEPNFHSFKDQIIDMYCKHEAYQGKPLERWSVARKTMQQNASRELKAAALAKLDAMAVKRKGAA